MKKYRARKLKHCEQNNDLPQVNCTVEVSEQTSMCSETQQKQANCLRDVI